MLVLTRGSSLRLSSVFIYSPGSLSIITRLAVEVHITITRHNSSRECRVTDVCL